MDNVLKVIKNLNIRDEYVILACSYGPDSMVLLDILIKENINVVVAHVNHKLRKESEEEKLLLEKYCKDNNLIFELFEIDNYPKGNFEMNARNLRYDFFEKILKKYNSKYLFTAHHGDDLVETVLMRLTRGSSFKGYAGFNILSKKRDYRLVRPLIYLTKENILDYANNNNISYAIDHTDRKSVV